MADIPTEPSNKTPSAISTSQPVGGEAGLAAYFVRGSFVRGSFNDLPAFPD